MAELKTQSGGALETLARAIEKLIVDLNMKVDRSNDEFSDRTALHLSETSRL